jgi:hypothetical protein
LSKAKAGHSVDLIPGFSRGSIGPHDVRARSKVELTALD